MTDKNKTRQLLFPIDNELHARLKILAAMRQTTMKALAQELIKTGLDKAYEGKEGQIDPSLPLSEDRGTLCSNK